jgi:hypothetical protein
MERLLIVEIGPSRSQRFGKALAEARSGPGQCDELAPGRYRASFLLGERAESHRGLARLLERVRHWRATEVYEGDEPVSAFQAKGDGLMRRLLSEEFSCLPHALLLGRPSPLLALSAVRCRAGDPGRARREPAAGAPGCPT